MKRIAMIVSVLLLLSGCAAKHGPVEGRSGNTITYEQVEGDGFVSFAIEGDYVYDEPVNRVFMGIDLKGHLFKSADGSTVLVAKFPKDEFEDLIGREINTPVEGIKSYPPRTAYLDRLCRLARVYLATMDTEVLAAVKILPMNDENGECPEWIYLSDVKKADPEFVRSFEQTGDEAISIHQ